MLKKINDHFTESRDTWSWWQAIQTITDYKPRHRPVMMTHPSQIHSTTFIRLKCRMTHLHKNCPHLPTTRRSADVRKTLPTINPCKAAGPDNIPGHVLKDCADRCPNRYLQHLAEPGSHPHILKSTTIIQVPKNSPVSCLNDYRPIALTPIIMKCFERLVMHNIKTSLPQHTRSAPVCIPPKPFYRWCNSLHLALTHLENKDSYVRMLFIDFSSAFNTIIPQQLINKLNLLGLNNSLCNWILYFLTGRPQSVRVSHNSVQWACTNHL